MYKIYIVTNTIFNVTKFKIFPYTLPNYDLAKTNKQFKYFLKYFNCIILTNHRVK